MINALTLLFLCQLAGEVLVRALGITFPGPVLGLGLIFAPSIQTAVSGLTNQDATVGSALVTTMQQIGGSIGIAIFSTLFASTASDYVVDHATGATTPAAQAALMGKAAIEGYGTVYLWSGVIFVTGAVLAALMLRNGTIETDPEAVMAH